MAERKDFFVHGMTIVDGEPTLFGVVPNDSPELYGNHVQRFQGDLLVSGALSDKPNSELPTIREALTSFRRAERASVGQMVVPKPTYLTPQRLYEQLLGEAGQQG